MTKSSQILSNQSVLLNDFIKNIKVIMYNLYVFILK